MLDQRERVIIRFLSLAADGRDQLTERGIRGVCKGEPRKKGSYSPGACILGGVVVLDR